MELKLQNVGIIESAEIRIDGLTVIAGNNDVGKSFIGKALYLAVKSYSGEDELRKEKIESEVKILLEDFILGNLDIIKSQEMANEGVLRRIISNATSRISSFDSLIDFVPELSIELLKLKDFLFGQIASIARRKVIDDSFFSLRERILETTKKHFQNKFIDFETAEDLVEDIFEGQISPKHQPILHSGIFLDSFELTIENNKVLSIYDTGDKSPFENITYIESPAIYLIAPIIKNELLASNRKVRDNNFVAYNIDLARKLVGQKYELDKTQEKLVENIVDVIGGKLEYQEFLGNFMYQKQNGSTFSQNNTASGIKWFGLLQVLLASGNIRKGSLIVIDEPETHLHPKWQVEYAKIIVEMVKNGIYVVLSSHSPYMIEALKRISDKEIADKTSFYLGEYDEKQHSSVFKDVTESISPIFKTLSAPMNELYLNI